MLEVRIQRDKKQLAVLFLSKCQLEILLRDVGHFTIGIAHRKKPNGEEVLEFWLQRFFIPLHYHPQNLVYFLENLAVVLRVHEVAVEVDPSVRENQKEIRIAILQIFLQGTQCFQLRHFAFLTERLENLLHVAVELVE